jgi:SpoVK/Ycf46/Vps4 family AAA+-type ATPase
VDYWVSDDRKNEESEVTFTVTTADHAWLNGLLPSLRKWKDANHFLRGRAFSAEGKFLRPSPIAWDDVILPSELRTALQRNCIDLLKHAALYRANGVPLRRGIVLHGPPGTGKTTIGRLLAQRCGVTFVLCTPGMLEEAADVRRVFKWGRRFAPAILFFEDFDLVAPGRHGGAARSILGEFLSCLDGLDSGEGVIAIATTNDLKAIEPALKDRPNRFDCVLEVPALSLENRVLYLERFRQWSMDTSEPATVAGATEHSFNSQVIAKATGAFTGAQMQELCRLAIFEAVEEHLASGAQEARRLPLATGHFEAALRRMGLRRKRAVGFTTNIE